MDDWYQGEVFSLLALVFIKLQSFALRVGQLLELLEKNDSQKPDFCLAKETPKLKS